MTARTDACAAGPALRHWNDGAGRSALALHCSLAHSGAWSGLAAALPDLHLVAPDLPGHGRAAPLPPGADLHDVATWRVHELLDRMPGMPDLIGHSFGATIALRVALERPGRLRSLTLIEPVLFSILRGTAAFVDFAQGYGAVDRAIDAAPEQAAAAFHAVWGHGTFADLPQPQQDYISARMTLIRAQNPTLLQDAPGLVAPGRLEGLDLPVLLLEGGDSPPVIAAIQAALAARLPQAKRVVVAGAAHMLPITDPAQVAAHWRATFAAPEAASVRTG